MGADNCCPTDITKQQHKRVFNNGTETPNIRPETLLNSEILSEIFSASGKTGSNSQESTFLSKENKDEVKKAQDEEMTKVWTDLKSCI